MTFKSVRNTVVAALAPLFILSLSTASSYAQCTLNGGANPCVLNGPVNITSGYSAGNNTTTTANGVLNNTSTMTFTSGANNTIMNLNANTTLTGGGTVTLSETGGGGVFFQQSVGGVVLDNLNNTIQGAGVIGNGGLTFSNEGTVNANSSGQVLFLNGSGGVTNSGTMGASGGGILDIQSTTNNAGGNITASGTGIVNIQAAITGGTLNSTGGGTLQTIANGSATLNSVTISSGSTYSSGNNTDVFVSGTLTNNGNLNLSSAANNTIMGLNTSTTLTGGGTVTMSESAGGGVFIEQQVGGLTLENVNNTIQGAGTIGNGAIALQNDAAGKIIANANGQTLFLSGSGGVTNHGLLQATNGGILQIQNTIANAGANITADGGSVVLQSAVINGGTLNSLNGGVLQTAANGIATLNVVTLSTGSAYSSGNNTDLFVSGTLTNNGAIHLSSAANNTIFGLSANTTLTGGGTLTMSTSGGGGVFVQQQVGGLTLTNHDNLIQGAGTIGNGGIALVNESAGVINANVSGQTLLLDGSGGVVNKGLLEATNSGTLQIQSTAVNNFGANISGTGGGTVVLNSATIQGGTLNGTFQTVANGVASLDGTTQGAITISTGSTYTTGNNTDLFVQGTITNNGAINVTAGANNTILGLGNNTTLNGGGTVNLSDGAGAAIIQQQVGGLTLTNFNNTIHGAGVIGNGGLAVLNQAGGLIDANLAGQTLFMNGSGGTTNLGLIEATNNGTLQFSGTTVNNAGGNISGLGGGTVVLNSATIQGGTLNGTFQTVANGVGTLDGSTNGAVTLSSGATYTSGNNTDLFAFGTINNSGNIQIAAAANNTFLGMSNNLTLNGPGAVTLSQSAGGLAILQQDVGGLTLTNNSTIQGAGIIGNGGLAVVNTGTIAANAGGAQTLLMNGSGGLDNHLGTLTAVNNSTLLVTAPVTASTFSAGVLNGHYLVDGTSGLSNLKINALGNTGGEVTTLGDGVTSTSVTLSGTIANTKFLDSAGNNALAITAVSTNASLTLQNGYALNGGTGGVTNSGNVSIDATSSLNTGLFSYQQNAGNTTLNGTLTSTPAGINILGGTFQGTGSVVANSGQFASAATLLPGSLGTGGTMSFSGSLAFNGILDEVITGSGTTLSSLGLTTVGNSLSLLGSSNLDFMTGAGFAPAIGTKFTIMTSGVLVAGTFGSLSNNLFDGGLEKWNVLYNDGGVGNVVLEAAAVNQIDAIWTTASGNWTSNTGGVTNWSCNPVVVGGCVPNNSGIGGYAVTLNSTGNTMTLNNTDTPSNIQVNSLNNKAGTLVVAGGATLTTLGDVTNSDTFQVNGPGSQIHVQGNLTNFSGGTLTGGNYFLNTGGTMKVDGLGNGGGQITTIASGTQVVLNGAGSAILDQTGSDALTGLATNNGVLVVQGGRNLSTSGALTNNGGLAVGATSTFSVGGGAGGYTNTNFTNVQGTFNAGSYTDSGTTHVGEAGSSGILNVTGTVTESNTMVVFANGVVNGGAYVNSGGTDVFGKLNSTNYNDNAGGTTTIENLGVLTATGTYTENGGATLIKAGGKLTAGTIDDNSGSIQVDGTLDPLAVDVFAFLSGTGTVVGDISNDGTVIMGDNASSPGTLHETGIYTQHADGTLLEAISNSANGELAITGNASLAGTLDIALLGGFNPTVNELFTLMTFTGAESGTFSSIIGADLGEWTVLYNANNVELEFVGGEAHHHPSLNRPSFCWTSFWPWGWFSATGGSEGRRQPSSFLGVSLRVDVALCYPGYVAQTRTLSCPMRAKGFRGW